MNLVEHLRIAAPTILLLLAGPALAGSPPPQLDAYGDLPDIEDIAISPSGKGLAVVGKIKGERQLLVLDDQRIVRTLSSIGDAKLWYIAWAGEDIVNVVTSATVNLGYGFTTNKAELQGVIIVPLTGDKSQLVFSRTPSMAKAIWGNYGTRFIDDHWVGYFSGIEYGLSADRTTYVFDHGRPALFAVDLKGNKPHKIARAASEDHCKNWLVDHNGRVAVTLDISSVNGKWEITNERGDILASGVDPTGHVNLISLGNTGASVIYSLEDKENQKSRKSSRILTSNVSMSPRKTEDCSAIAMRTA